MFGTYMPPNLLAIYVFLRHYTHNESKEKQTKAEDTDHEKDHYRN